MDHLVGISERPFQLMSLLCLGFAGLFAVRIALAWAVPISILPEVTPGVILNAIALGFLVVLSVLAGIGEYVMRNFLMTQRYPGYVIREIHEKHPTTGADG
jgi:hypothetical protein